MTNLISLENVSLAYGLDPLLDKIQLQISSGERVCLIGRNGAGKSSLIKIIDGVILPDSGFVWRKPHLRIARLTQELPQDTNISVYEFVAQGLEHLGKLLSAYHKLLDELTNDHSEKKLAELERLQHEIDINNGWKMEQDIKAILTKLELNGDQRLVDLSGGWQRRAALAKALVLSPELLLLDEPTNHLDIEAIEWLEQELLSSGVALLFITHDRALLKRLATRIIELDRGQLTSWPGDYENFLRRKEELLHAEAKQNADFDKKLAQEERWIRQGIKARRTRNEGRARALYAMRVERTKRREVQGKATFNINEGDQSGQIVIEAKNVTHGFNPRPLINNFSIRIMRGDRIGLIGPNGVGKSTLLNILLGNLVPQQGTATQGTRLQAAYFDQLRHALDPEKTVMENVAEGQDFVEINGKRQHAISYLNDFLFTPARTMTPVKALSGGECNRLLLAKLFSRPANLLVMDEPTNDLDIETLELLEDLLSDYQGTLLLVSHDRAFLDNVITSALVFEGNGKIQEHVGGYQDWQQYKNTSSKTVEKPVTKAMPERVKQSKKLSYKEQKELNELPEKIAALEKQFAELQDIANSENFYQQKPEVVKQSLSELNDLQLQIEQAYQRWEELDAL